MPPSENSPYGDVFDYIVIGAGASAMAFVDALLSLDHAATVVMVDRQSHPGGHWNDAYPFVRLHQPSLFYGVNSVDLGSMRVQELSVNRGAQEQASKHEILDYYDKVMRRTLLASGRVTWLPLHNLEGDAEGSMTATSLVSGKARSLRARRRVVDTTLTAPSIPSSHQVPYAVSVGVCHVRIGELSSLSQPFHSYTIIGGGKTGIDACLWLLEQGVDAEAIRWIVPCDFWLLNRDNF